MEEEVRGLPTFHSKFATYNSSGDNMIYPTYYYPGQTCVIRQYSKLSAVVDYENSSMDSGAQAEAQLSAFLKIGPTIVDPDQVYAGNSVYIPSGSDINVTIKDIIFSAELIRPDRQRLIATNGVIGTGASSVLLDPHEYCSNCICYLCIIPIGWTSSMLSGDIKGDYVYCTIGDLIRRSGGRVIRAVPVLFAGYSRQDPFDVKIPAGYKLNAFIYYNSAKPAFSKMTEDYGLVVNPDNAFVMLGINFIGNITYEPVSSSTTN